MRQARPTRGAARMAVGLFLSFACCASAFAQNDARLEPNIESLIEALDDERFSERERASVALEIRADELDALLNNGYDLSQFSLEQVERIGRALRSRFFATPRAALGVRFGQQLNALVQGLPLQDVLNGFPSATVLRGGDIVVSVDGAPLVDLPTDMAQQMMRASILSRDPGEILPMTVRRGNIELAVDVPLGAYRDLGGGVAALSNDELTRAWMIRAARLGLTRYSGGVIEPDLARREWPQHRQQVNASTDASAVGGGTGHAADFGEALQVAQGERVEAIRDEQLKQVRDDLQSQMSMFQLQLEVIERQATNPTATDAERRQASMLRMQIESRIAELQRQIDQLDGRR